MNGSTDKPAANGYGEHGPSPMEMIKQRLVAHTVAVGAELAEKSIEPVARREPYSNAAAERLFGKPIAKLLAARAQLLASIDEHRGKKPAEIATLAREQLRADYTAAIEGRPDCAERLASDFKRWLGVISGEYQRRIEVKLRESRPHADEPTIQARAGQLVREHLERADLKWKLFVADDKMCEMLRRQANRGDAEAAGLLDRFQRLRARLQNHNDADRAAALQMIDVLEDHFAIVRDRMAEDLQRIRELTDGGKAPVPAGTEDYVSPDAGFAPQTDVAVPATEENGVAKLQRNALNEPLDPKVEPAMEFLRAHQRDRSEAPNAASQRLVDAVTEELHAALAWHLRFAAEADVDSLFARPAGGGDRPNGSVGDLITLLESTHNDPAAATSEYCQKYLNEWNRVVIREKSATIDSRFDVDIALAARHRAGDKDYLEMFEQEYNLSHGDAAAALATGIDPARSELLRGLRWAERSDFYRESQRQIEISAEQRTANLRRNIARAEKQRKAGLSENGSSDHSPSSTGTASADEPAATGNEKLDTQIRIAGNRKLFAEQFFDRATLHYQAARELPIVSLPHLADFWRRAIPEKGERSCMRGVACVCRLEDNAFVRGTSAASLRGKRASERFICREFLTEQEQQNFDQFGKLDFAPRMCYFCELFTTTTEVLRRDCDRESSAMLIQRFGVEIGPGGVDPDACLPVEHGGRATGIVRPIPRFDRNSYQFSTTEKWGQTVPCIVVMNLDFRLGSENGMPT